MKALEIKKIQYNRRRRRSKVAFPVDGKLRLCVFKSAKHIEAQIIDDFNQTTMVSASSKEKSFANQKKNKTEIASMVGKLLSERAKKLKIDQVYFDRNGFRYHGRIKSLADSSREGGLNF